MVPTHLLSAGSNARGQLANGSEDDTHTFTPVSFSGFPPGTLPSSASNILQVAFGSNFTLLLLGRLDSHTELWVSGDGARGQLGPSHQLKRDASIFTPLDLKLDEYGLQGYHVRSVSAGWETSYAVLSRPDKDDAIISFGANDFGDLGIGQKGNLNAHRIHRVDARRSSRAHLESRLAVDFMVAGTHHVIAQTTTTLTDGASETIIIGWGASRHGQLGPEARSAPMQLAPIVVHTGQTSDCAVAGAAGSQHTVLLQASRSLWGLGANRKAQLASIDSIINASSLGCTWNGTYAAVGQLDQWSIVATGDNAKGQLGAPSSPHSSSVIVQFPFSAQSRSLIKMVCGSEHVLCLFSVRQCNLGDPPENEVWGWGWNEHGNLGLNHTNDVSTPVKMWPTPGDLADGRAVDVWAGCGTSWVAIEKLPS